MCFLFSPSSGDRDSSCYPNAFLSILLIIFHGPMDTFVLPNTIWFLFPSLDELGPATSRQGYEIH